MRVLAFVLAVAGAVLASTVSIAEPAMTAGDLQQLCAGTDHVSVNACRIYILGVTQGITVGMSMAAGKSHTARPCVPPGVSAEELEQKVKVKLDQRLSANPADKDLDAAGFIGTTLTATFHCPKAAP
ncbi:MAG: Rap1a/Tai family immunity protein [Steroidobacteraceae bacterium]